MCQFDVVTYQCIHQDFIFPYDDSKQCSEAKGTMRRRYCAKSPVPSPFNCEYRVIKSEPKFCGRQGCYEETVYHWKTCIEDQEEEYVQLGAKYFTIPYLFHKHPSTDVECMRLLREALDTTMPENIALCKLKDDIPSRIESAWESVSKARKHKDIKKAHSMVVEHLLREARTSMEFLEKSLRNLDKPMKSLVEAAMADTYRTEEDSIDKLLNAARGDAAMRFVARLPSPITTKGKLRGSTRKEVFNTLFNTDHALMEYCHTGWSGMLDSSYLTCR